MIKNFLRNIPSKGFERRRKLAVVGDIILDKYLTGETDRISPEAPIPVVNIKNSQYILGGAANVMSNLADLGNTVWGFGVIGSDKEGKSVLKQLSRKKINTKNIVSISQRPTSLKCRVLVGHHQMIRYDIETDKQISKKYQLNIFNGIKNIAKNIEFLIIPDYNKGVLTSSLIKDIINLSKKNKFKTIVDLKIQNVENYAGVDFAKINLQNAKIITQFNSSTNDLERICKRLSKIVKCKNLIMTLGKNGMVIYSKNKLEKFSAIAKEVYDVTGAGDVMTAVLATSLANGYDLKTSCAIGTIASAISVSKVGTYSVTRKELLSAINKYISEK